MAYQEGCTCGGLGRSDLTAEAGQRSLSNWDLCLLAEGANPRHVLPSQKVASQFLPTKHIRTSSPICPGVGSGAAQVVTNVLM